MAKLTINLETTGIFVCLRTWILIADSRRHLIFSMKLMQS